MEQIANIIFGGIGGSLLAWFLRNWISENLKQSIQYEYSQKLESYKVDLNSKIQAIQNENQINQLRTSLFFDHQREAFASLLYQIHKIEKKWFENYDPDEGLIFHVPKKEHKEFEDIYKKHLLFLDDDIQIGLDLINSAYYSSLPFDDGSGHLTERNPSKSYADVEYIQQRVIAVFRQKIGIHRNSSALRELALLGSIKLLNRFRFPDINLPIQGSLNINISDRPADCVVKAEKNINELIVRLKEFDSYLDKEGGFFYEAQREARQYIVILK